MTTFTYNDTEFSLVTTGQAWDIRCRLADGSTALMATGLFNGVGPEAALERARALVRAARPVGVKSVGPDVSHPNMVGDLKIVGPDITHANFANWEQDSSSFPSVVEPATRR